MSNGNRILVTGGSGHLGGDFARAAVEAGHQVRVASRRDRPDDAPETLGWAIADLAGGGGLSEAVAGMDTVFHSASDPRRAVAVDVEGTRRLVAAAANAGIAHFVYISIVGIDRIPFSYYRRKLEAEQIVESSGLPYSILRATQFHYFIDMLLGAAARVPLLLPLPAGFHVQSIAVAEVTARLLRAVEEGPGGRLPDLAGPEPMTLRRAARAWKTARGLRKPILPLPLPGKTAAAFRAGHNTAPDAERGTLTWADWLDEHYA